MASTIRGVSLGVHKDTFAFATGRSDPEVVGSVPSEWMASRTSGTSTATSGDGGRPGTSPALRRPLGYHSLPWYEYAAVSSSRCSIGTSDTSATFAASGVTDHRSGPPGEHHPGPPGGASRR